MNEYLVSCKHSWLYGKIKALYGGQRKSSKTRKNIRANMKRAEAMA